MGLFDLPRVPEPEIMDDLGEVEAYSSAAAQAHLKKIDATFVEHALCLVKGCESGRALDVGTGPGQIVIQLARQLEMWKFVGVDRSPHMISQARSNLGSAGTELAGRVEFQVADGTRLDFPDASFDFVICNSVLHHLAEPQSLLSQIARLAKPTGGILLRDLRRPSRLTHLLHLRWHGRHYSGVMNELYRDSVRSAYTEPELQRLLDSSALHGVRLFTHHSTHLGLERPASLASRSGGAN
jgi:ubiquinone/menaquinone biosynthesis C-methylase UbiE